MEQQCGVTYSTHVSLLIWGRELESTGLSPWLSPVVGLNNNNYNYNRWNRNRNLKNQNTQVEKRRVFNTSSDWWFLGWEQKYFIRSTLKGTATNHSSIINSDARTCGFVSQSKDGFVTNTLPQVDYERRYIPIAFTNYRSLGGILEVSPNIFVLIASAHFWNTLLRCIGFRDGERVRFIYLANNFRGIHDVIRSCDYGQSHEEGDQTCLHFVCLDSLESVRCSGIFVYDDLLKSIPKTLDCGLYVNLMHVYVFWYDRKRNRKRYDLVPVSIGRKKGREREIWDSIYFVDYFF